MNTVTIDPQEVEFWLAYTEGWKKAAGFIVTIQGIKFSFCVSGILVPKLLISELSSGTKVWEFSLTIEDALLRGATKEGLLEVFEEYAEAISKEIDPILKEKITTQSAIRKREREAEFGKMPEIVPFDMDKWMEESQ